MQTIGVIGGFSPEATALFYVKLTRLARMGKKTTLPHIIVWNVPVPIKLERRLLTRGEGLKEIRPLLIEAAQGLERAGADIIVLPCNTLHTQARNIRKHVRVPFIDIVDASIKELRRLEIKTAGLLGSSITADSDLFSGQTDIHFIAPDRARQQNLTEAIHGAVSGRDILSLPAELHKNLTEFRRHGVTHVLLACTDFSDICPTVKGVQTHDTLTILADEVNAYSFYKNFRRRILS